MRASGSPDVHVGSDGWLFLIRGSNDVAGQFRLSLASYRRLRRWKRLVLSRIGRCDRLGCRFVQVFVPEKLSIYDHKLAGLPFRADRSPALRLRRSLSRHPRALAAFPDLVGLFRRHRDAADLYLRTDSHWSFVGSNLAYRAICAACAAAPRDDLAERPFRLVEQSGDLGRKLDPPHTERVRVHAVRRDAARVFASPIIRLREAAGAADTVHVGTHVIYRNEAAGADPRRMVLFGDSFAHFQPIMLTIMLAETFREVHFVWSSSIDWGFVERIGPEIVVSEIAERFMAFVPRDDFDLEAYAEERYGTELKAADALG